MFRFLLLVIAWSLLLSGCRTNSSDRLPNTAVDNPDPIFGGTAKSKTASEPAGNQPVAGTPTGQQRTNDDRIGPLNFKPQNTTPTQATAIPGASPGTAALTTGVKPPVAEQPKDSSIQQAAITVPASNPAVVEEYRQRMNRFGVVGLRTKALANGTWEAVGHFPTTTQPNQLRRIEAQGANESDALLAILEQLEKPQ